MYITSIVEAGRAAYRVQIIVVVHERLAVLRQGQLPRRVHLAHGPLSVGQRAQVQLIAAAFAEGRTGSPIHLKTVKIQMNFTENY